MTTEDVDVAGGRFDSCLLIRTQSSSGEAKLWLCKGIGVVRSHSFQRHPDDDASVSPPWMETIDELVEFSPKYEDIAFRKIQPQAPGAGGPEGFIGVWVRGEHYGPVEIEIERDGKFIACAQIGSSPGCNGGIYDVRGNEIRFRLPYGAVEKGVLNPDGTLTISRLPGWEQYGRGIYRKRPALWHK